MDKKMDLLLMVAFAPDNSAFGVIEHDWSIVSKSLCGVVFDTCLPGEDKPPQKQKLTNDERLAKEAKLFDSILVQLKNLYSPITTTEYPATTFTVPCLVCSGRFFFC
jgi:hypothetical protein